MKELNRIYNEDCLVGMDDIPDHSIDCIICDLPYGVLNKSNTNAQWDKQLPMQELWKHYNRIIKESGAIILFGQGMFTALVMMSNPKDWKYNLIWKKGTRSSGFLNAHKMPLRNHEDIMVFYKKPPTYNPQMWKGKPNHSRGTKIKDINNVLENRCYGSINYSNVEDDLSGNKYPLSVIDIDREHSKECFHPTQKPVALIEYLIKTYSNEGDTILDNCMGSGTTAIAAMNTGRNFIGFELDENYYNKAIERIKLQSKEI